MPNFATILDTPSQNVQPPKPVPPGTYVCRIVGAPEHKVSNNDRKTEYLLFAVALVEALDDVDETELAESLNGEPLINHTITLRQYVTEKSLYRLKKFLGNDLGINEEGKTIRMMLDEVQGAEFIAEIKHVPSFRDPNVMIAEIASTTPAS